MGLGAAGSPVTNANSPCWARVLHGAKGLTEAPASLQHFECGSEFESGDTRDGRQIRFGNEPGDFEDEFVPGREQPHGLGKLSFSVCLHKPNSWISGLVDCWVGRVMECSNGL